MKRVDIKPLSAPFYGVSVAKQAGGSPTPPRCVERETTHLSLGRVRGAQHPPLGRLQGARPADLAGLLELGGDAGHHAQGGDEGEAGQHLGHALPVHLEPLQGPVPLWRRAGFRGLISCMVQLEQG